MIKACKYPLALLLLISIIPFLLALKPFSDVHLSPTAICSNAAGTQLFVAESGARKVDIVEAAGGEVVGSIRLPQNPSGLTLSGDEKTLYVTGDDPQGKLLTIDLDKGRVVHSMAAGHTPMSPVIDPAGQIIYLCNRFNNSIAVIDLAQQKVVADIPVKREPIACVLVPDGSLLFVANHLPVGTADRGDIAAEVEIIDTEVRGVIKSIRLSNGSSSLRGMCIAPDGKFVYVTHLISRYTMPTTQLERGWMNTNALSIIDVQRRELLNTVLLDDMTQGAANPWAIACSPDGKTLCLTHAGTHEVSIIDRVGLHAKLDQVGRGEYTEDPSLSAVDVPNTLSFLGTLRKRQTLAVKGPRGCAVTGDSLFVTGYFSDNLERIDLTQGKASNEYVIALGPQTPLSEARRGEMLFNDADLCFQKWQSCASCHPDSRVDGLNWDLMNDGLGNPKNTRSMLFSHKTPPVMSLGVRKEAEVAVRAGIRFIQFAERSEQDAEAIDTYLQSMKPVSSPHLVKGRLNEAARRGKKVFKQAGCIDCHSGKLSTNLKQYDLGLGAGMDETKPFDTPTLREVWRTAPYLHDGRAATIMDVLTTCNPNNLHGRTASLSQQQLENLAEYVLSQ